MSEISLSDLRWLAFTASHPEALCFHRPAWTEMIADCYGYRPFVLAVLGERGNIVAGLPVIEAQGRRRRRWISLPFSDNCQPLLHSPLEAGKFARALEEARLEAGVGSLEVRSALVGAEDRQHSDGVSHRAELEREPDLLFARFHRSQVQRNVRRAEREQAIVVRRAESAEDLTRSFYRLQMQTRRRLGMPVQPRRFFEALWSHLLEPEHGYLLLAYSGREPVAGAVFLAGSSTVTYKYGASDAAFWRHAPTTCSSGARCVGLASRATAGSTSAAATWPTRACATSRPAGRGRSSRSFTRRLPSGHYSPHPGADSPWRGR